MAKDKKKVSDDELRRLEQELYATTEPAELKERSEELARLGHIDTAGEFIRTGPRQEEGKFTDVHPLMVHRRRRLLLINGIGLLVFIIFTVAALGTWWYRLSRQVNDGQVVLELFGPTEATSGQEVSYRVSYGNNSLVEWQDVEVIFEPPSGFTFKDTDAALDTSGRQYVARIGNLPPNEQRAFRVNGYLVGEQNESGLIKTQIVLTPVNFPSGAFTKETEITTAIVAFTLEMAVEASRDVAPGERIQVPIQVRNVGDEPLEGAYLKLGPGEGITLAVEDPAFSPEFSVPNSRWQLPTIQPLQTLTRTMAAYVEGPPGGQLVLDVEAGIASQGKDFVQRRVQSVFQMSLSELAVEQEFLASKNELVVQPSQKIDGVVRYRNSGNIGLKNAIVTLQFEGQGLDPASLRLPTGAYDSRTRRITWTAATVPALRLLQPQQEGELHVQFATLPVESFPKSGDHTQNFTIVTTAAVDSPDLPTPVGQTRQVFSDRFVMSVATAVDLRAEVLYDDGRLGIFSTGPHPPQVGKETTYTLRLQAGSLLNDLGTTRVTATIPDGVRYTGKHFRTAGELDFNDRTGEIAWSLPLLNAGTGRLRPHEELQLQVSVTPAEHLLGSKIELLHNLRIEGVDQFTESTVQYEYDDVVETENVRTETGARS